MTPTYTISFFIAKLSSIPEEKWCQDTLVNNSFGYSSNCVMGQCGSRSRTEGTNEESRALERIVVEVTGTSAWRANDGLDGTKKYGNTPKRRIMEILRQAYENAMKVGNYALAGNVIDIGMA